MRYAIRLRSRQLLLLGLVAALAAGLGLGLTCSFAATSTPSAAPGKVILRIGWLESPDNLNPFIGNLWATYMVWVLNYDVLVGYDPTTLAPTPDLATSWSVSPDGKTWTFKIRSGVKWQDGVPLTAKDVAFTFNYIVDNDITSLAVYTEGLKHATAIDDTTVEVTTSAPKANMLRMWVPILPEHIWSKVKPNAATKTYQNKPPIIGSGPFQVVEFQQDKFVRLQAYKDYWGGAPKIDELIFQIYENPQNMANELRTGAIQGALGVPTAQFAALSDAAGITTNKAVSWTFNELGFNCYDSPNSLGNPVLRDPQFRRALQWAVDRQQICSTAWQGYAVPGSTVIVPYSSYAWQPLAADAYSYDPAKANALLDAAGYARGPDGVRRDRAGKPIVLRLYVTTDSPQNQAADRIVVANLADVGVKVKLSVMDTGALLDALYSYKGNTFAPDFDMITWYWGGEPDPNWLLSCFTPQQIENLNEYCWSDAEYAKLNTEQGTTIDQAQRTPIVQQMEKVVYESTPFIVLDYYYQLEAYDTAHWSGWVKTPNNIPGWSGAVFNSFTPATFVNVRPVAASATQGSTNTGLIVALIVAAAAVALVVVLLLRRRRGRALDVE